MTTPSVDTMLGLINNANQTSTIIGSQRDIADAIRSSSEKQLYALKQELAADNLHASSENQMRALKQELSADNLRSSSEKQLYALKQDLMAENKQTENLISMNNSFANQNLSSLGASLKDLIQVSSSANATSIEKNGTAAVTATERIGSQLSHSLERIGGDNINATDRNGSLNLLSTERIGNNMANLLNQNNSLLNNNIKETQVTSERNFGETKLFNSTQHQQLERRIGDYHLHNERNFNTMNTDLLKVENSLGRLTDNHHTASMVEMLKIHASLDKSIDRTEHNIYRQGADNYANIQIEAAKNKAALEQKMTELSNDIKISLYKDNNETRQLINSYNNDNVRNDLQSEKIIHALHHHHNHHNHREDRHDRHNHYYPPFFPYSGFPLQGNNPGSPGNGGNGRN